MYEIGKAIKQTNGYVIVISTFQNKDNKIIKDTLKASN